jgi:hypothetical protein
MDITTLESKFEEIFKRFETDKSVKVIKYMGEPASY